jgi:hypothetical protein
MKKKLDTKPFNKVYSQEEIDEVDKRIMEAKRKHDTELYDALLKAKDFPMNN